MRTPPYLGSSDGWINALEAAESLAAIIGSFKESKVLIADRLFDECLSVRVALYADDKAINEDRSISKRIRRSIELGSEVGRPLDIMYRNYEIPFGLWNRSYDWHADVASWRWADGAFLISYTEGMYIAGSRRQARMWGAQFKASDIADLIEMYQRSNSSRSLVVEGYGLSPEHSDLGISKVNNGGKFESGKRRPTPKQWELIIGNLERLADNGKLGDDFGAPTWGTQAAVAFCLIERAADLGVTISEATAKRRAAALLKRNNRVRYSKPHEPI